MEEIVVTNKLHFECTDFNSSTRVTECIYVLTECLKYLSIQKHSYFIRQNVCGFDKSRLVTASARNDVTLL